MLIKITAALVFVFLFLSGPFSHADDSISKVPVINSASATLNLLMIGVMNVPPGDPIIFVNGKDVTAQLTLETGSEQMKFYQLQGSPDQFNLSVGKNDIVVKYGGTILPTFHFKYTVAQQQQAEQYKEMLKPHIYEVMFIYNILRVTVGNRPPGDPIIFVNGKDVSSRLTKEDQLAFEIAGSPDQLNLSVGKNDIVVKYGDTLLPVFHFKCTSAQWQDVKMFNDRLKR
jgi:hypothetical protein